MTTLAREDVTVYELPCLPPELYYELLDGRLIGLPFIGVDEIRALDQAIAARSSAPVVDRGEMSPAVVVTRGELFTEPRVSAVAGLRHWWVIEETIEGNVDVTAYRAVEGRPTSDREFFDDSYPFLLDLPEIVRSAPRVEETAWPMIG